MSYYDDAYYSLNANIASQNSILVDLKYRYNRLLSKIVTMGPENVPIDLVNEQLGLVNSIKEKKQTISMLEAQLTGFTSTQAPEVVLQEILEEEKQVEQVSQRVQQVPEEISEILGQVPEEISEILGQVPEEVVQTTEPVVEPTTEPTPEPTTEPTHIAKQLQEVVY